MIKCFQSRTGFSSLMPDFMCSGFHVSGGKHLGGLSLIVTIKHKARRPCPSSYPENDQPWNEWLMLKAYRHKTQTRLTFLISFSQYTPLSGNLCCLYPIFDLNHFIFLGMNSTASVFTLPPKGRHQGIIIFVLLVFRSLLRLLWRSHLDIIIIIVLTYILNFHYIPQLLLKVRGLDLSGLMNLTGIDGQVYTCDTGYKHQWWLYYLFHVLRPSLWYWNVVSSGFSS